MSRNKFWVLLMVFALIGSLATCGFAAGKTKIVFMNSKGEVTAQLEEAARIFSKENPGIQVEIVVAPVGQSPFERLSALYGSGNAPALSMLDGGDVPKFKDKYLDLSKEKWVKDSLPGMLTDCTYSGKVITFPFCAEGYGFIYNKAVLDKADVDPGAIKTTSDLKAAFEKVKASGVDPLIIGAMDWNLGNHFLAIAYADQSNKAADVAKFINSLKVGKANLAGNKVFNGLMSTFDVMMAYNAAKNDPLSVAYEKGAELLGQGKVGFWFMGTWAWGNIKSFDTANGAYGFIPVPISDNAADYGNSGIVAGITKFVGIDKSQNNKAQQAAAKKFLNWLVYSKSGQDAITNKMALVAPFKNALEPGDPLGKSMVKYMNAGKTVQFMSVLPADHWSKTGASMQKYLAGKLDKAGLAKEIEEYWKTVK
ncbi:MAG: ABC transporter substrate-binding protein [Bacillota bacterium]